jgi:hypothetical protein
MKSPVQYLGQDDQTTTGQSWFWKNFHLILISGFTGLLGMWAGWELGKLRCEALYLIEKGEGAVGKAVGGIESGVSAVRSKVGLKKKRNKKKAKA